VSFSYHHREGFNVRNTVLATAVAATLALAAPEAFAQAKGSATKAEVQAIEAQMKAVAERLNKLEASNTQLQNENEQLKAVVDRRDAEIDYLKSQTRELREEGAVVSNEVNKVKGADWATKIKFKGDLRLRDENITQDRLVPASPATTPASAEVDDAADRNRLRIRARFGFDATVTDNVKATLQLATGADDPRSSNQTLTGEATRKSIGLDLAYIDWKFMNGGNLTAGKVKYPFWRPGQSLFFDGDFNPEGVAVAFDRGMLFGSGYGWWLEERFAADPVANNADTIMLGAQLGVKFPLLGGETRLAAHYYDLGGGQYSNPFYNNNANGNSTVTQGTGTSAIQVLAYDYNVLMLSGEMGMTLFNLPFSFWADYAMNNADDVEDETAYSVGVSLGKAGNAKTWEAGIFYQDIGKDALFAQLIDSDFGDGVADAEGWVLKGGYAPVRNVTLNATYFINTLNRCGTGTAPNNRLCGSGIPEYELDYNRLQLDVNYKF
jgi:hypothetical protein